MMHRLIFFSAAILFFISSAIAAQPDPQKKYTIRNIDIEVSEIFDEADLQLVYRLANQLKIDTQKNVIARELLFKVGDTYDHFLLEESERNLRSLGIIDRIKITPSFDADQVDIKVKVHDTWTLIPQLSYSSGSGSGSNFVAGISESDILGLGKRAEVLYADVDNRQEIQAVYDDPRVWESRNRFLAAFFDRSDGEKGVFHFGRPFRSLVEKHAWGFDLNFGDIVNKLYENGDERFIFRQKDLGVGVRYTLASGDPEKARNRYTFGYNYVDNRFSMPTAEDFDDADVDPADVSQDPDLLASNRRFSAPYFTYSLINPDFISLSYVDRFERVQDFNLGNEFSVTTALAPEFIGSDTNAVLFTAGDSIGQRFGQSGFILGGLGVSSRLEDGGGLANNIFYADLKFISVRGPQYIGDMFLGTHTLAASLSMDIANDLDRDLEFLLGGTNGLRGYDARSFTGNKRLILNLEDRFHIADDVYKLVSIGGTIFADVGGTSSDSFGEIVSKRLYSDVGAGLRISFPRSSGARVLRFEVAVPLRDADDGSDAYSPRFLVQGGLAFDSRPRAQLDPTALSNVAIGLSD